MRLAKHSRTLRGLPDFNQGYGILRGRGLVALTASDLSRIKLPPACRGSWTDCTSIWPDMIYGRHRGESASRLEASFPAYCWKVLARSNSNKRIQIYALRLLPRLRVNRRCQEGSLYMLRLRSH